jgi:hypothetical protein
VETPHPGRPRTAGATIVLTTDHEVDRLGRVYANTPIPPDEFVADDGTDAARAAAVAWLAGKSWMA